MKRLNLNDYDLIGISGPIGAGKDTIAKWIQRQGKRSDLGAIPWVISPFAYPLKKACSEMFGWSMQQIEDREFKETVDPFYGITPRKAMQLLGTEYGRQMIRDDLWVKIAERQRLDNLQKGIKTIIPDVRFQNEDDYVRSVPNSLRICVVPDVDEPLNEKHLHVSEIGLVPKENDLVIVNIKSHGVQRLYNTLWALFD